MKSIDSIKSHHFKVSSPTGHHPFPQSPYPDLRQDPFFVGRSQELNTIITNLLQNRHTLITGDRGIGKTRLMYEAISLLTGATHRVELPDADRGAGDRIVIFVDSPSPLSKFIKRLAAELIRLHRLKAVNAMKETELTDSMIEALTNSTRKNILFIDNLETVTPSHRIFIERLLDTVTICGSSQSIKQQPPLKKIFDSFAAISVRPLDTEDAAVLVRHLTERYKIRALDKTLFTSQIIKASQGNPFQLKTFLHTAATKGFMAPSDTRQLIYSANDRDYFNMGPLYALGLAIFSLSKILSIGASNKEFYILMSSLGFLAYLVFRIFRSFFTLKPRSNKPG